MIFQLCYRVLYAWSPLIPAELNHLLSEDRSRILRNFFTADGSSITNVFLPQNEERSNPSIKAKAKSMKWRI